MSTTAAATKQAIAAALGVQPADLGSIHRTGPGRYEAQLAKIGMIVPVTIDDQTDDQTDDAAAAPAGSDTADTYGDMSHDELNPILAARGLPKTGNLDAKVERLEADDAARFNPTIEAPGSDT